MEEPVECISRFFQDSTPNKKYPLSSGGIPPHNCSQDSSQDLSTISQDSIESDPDMICLSQLTIAEQETLKVEPFYNITPRQMPLSPHYIFEEEFSTNPWAILIATIFLTKTAGKVARPYMKAFFDEYPTPHHVLAGCPNSLERFFENLGLRKRADTIWKLSYQFVSARWRRASDLCGIGKYGEDAYRIFCLGHTDLDPGDRYLKLYLDWLSGHTDYIDDWGVAGSECVIDDPVSKYYRLTLRDIVV